MLERRLTSETGSIIKRYASIARPDHWVKNIFMLPGTALALALYPELAAERSFATHALSTVIALIATCLIASANYTINEWLDADFDRFHPVKSSRPAVRGELDRRAVYAQYALLAPAGLTLAATIGALFTVFAVLLLVMGLIYNVEPLRSKDKAYIDVLSESINNPLRLLLGWSAITDAALPPISVLVSYWMGGAYLMAIKRYAEFRMIDDHALAARYRRSFAAYDEKKLLISAVFYAINSAFFLGIFLVKYRFEFLVSFPFFALLFSWYLGISMDARALAISPERLHQERKFAAYVCLLVAMLTALLFIDIPFLKYFVDYNQIIRHK